MIIIPNCGVLKPMPNGGTGTWDAGLGEVAICMGNPGASMAIIRHFWTMSGTTRWEALIVV